MKKLKGSWKYVFGVKRVIKVRIRVLGVSIIEVWELMLREGEKLCGKNLGLGEMGFIRWVKKEIIL